MSTANNKQPDIASLRENYSRAKLDLDTLHASPIAQFSLWLQEAIDAQLPEPNAMTLATASSSGRPSARIVLLKGVSEQGFTFYTNYDSDKGRELEENPSAALVFLWKELERQVRISGEVQRISPAASDDYFNSRPLGSRLGAIVSPQSRIIPDRSEMISKLAALEKLSASEIKRPENWGGYIVSPDRIEFWQGRPNRLHDRFRYSHDGHGNYRIDRLAP